MITSIRNLSFLNPEIKCVSRFGNPLDYVISFEECIPTECSPSKCIPAEKCKPELCIPDQCFPLSIIE